MPLDDLVQVIETIQQRIRVHGDTLRQNETRTRMALIDPLLTALGWDVADPGLVTAEYDVSGRRADYALRTAGNIPAATLEAKKLGESLEPHRMQMLNYSNAAGIRFAGLTDGNSWEFYEIFKQGTLEERRILEVSIASDSAFQCALKFLLLWRPNFVTVRPVEANAPILAGVLPTDAVAEQVVNAPPPTPALPATPREGWTSLADFRFTAGSPAPSAIRFPGEAEREAGRWNRLILESAEYLVRTGKLTPLICPVPVPGSARYSVHRESVHSDGKSFTMSRKLSNGLFCEVNVSGGSAVSYAKSLLQYCGQDLAAVHLKLG